jgi:hypothetical protein
MIEIEYAERGWVRSEEYDVNGQKRAIDKQTVWKRLEADEWACVELLRLPSDGFRPAAVHVENAHLMREFQPSGRFRVSTQLANFHAAVVLTPDDRVRNTQRPDPPKPADTPGTRYLASRDYAIPGRGRG